MAFASVSGICGSARSQMPATKSVDAGRMRVGRGMSRNGGIPCVAIPTPSPMKRTSNAETSGTRVRCDATKKTRMIAMEMAAKTGSGMM